MEKIQFRILTLVSHTLTHTHTHTHTHTATCRDYLNDESKDKKGVEFDLSSWTASTPKDIPYQMNGSDCGVFTCMVSVYM